MTCSMCGMTLAKGERCPSCTLYNAGITAVNVAAQEIAKSHDRRAVDAWMNDHGIYAWVGKSTVQVGTKEQAAPFMEMLSATRRVITFWRRASLAPGPDTTGEKR